MRGYAVVVATGAAFFCRFALRDLDEAVRLLPGDTETLVARAKTHRLLAERAVAGTEDPEPEFAKAIEDLWKGCGRNDGR